MLGFLHRFILFSLARQFREDITCSILAFLFNLKMSKFYKNFYREVERLFVFLLRHSKSIHFVSVGHRWVEFKGRSM